MPTAEAGYGAFLHPLTAMCVRRFLDSRRFMIVIGPNDRDRAKLSAFFEDWARMCCRALRPGAHVFIASNAYIVPLLFESLNRGGLQFRGQIIRTVRTLRGGDRPKNAEREFPDVSSMPRGCYEPWGLFRKPLLPGMKVSDALREFQTGGLRRLAHGGPFEDLLPSERTSRVERAIADHPSLKPQSLMRLLAYVALPFGEGIVIDPFAGSGSTIAAAEAASSVSGSSVTGLISIWPERLCRNLQRSARRKLIGLSSLGSTGTCSTPRRAALKRYPVRLVRNRRP